MQFLDDDWRDQIDAKLEVLNAFKFASDADDDQPNKPDATPADLEMQAIKK